MALSTPLKPLWAQPVVTDMFSNKFGGTPEQFIIQCSSKSGNLDPPGGLEVVATREADGALLWDSGMVGPTGDMLPPVNPGMVDFQIFGFGSVNAKGGAISIPGGGIQGSGGAIGNVYKSTIGGNIIPTWTTDQTLPGGYQVAQYAALQFGFIVGDAEYIYAMIAGGVDGTGNPQKKVYFGVCGAVGNGDVSWVAGPDLPLASCQGALAYILAANGDTYIYYLGGSTTGTLAGGQVGTTPTNTVYYCVMSAAGVLSGWTSTASLTTAVCGHAAVGGSTGIFVMGGWTGSATTNATQTSLPTQATGALPSWAAGPNLSVAVKYAHFASWSPLATGLSIILFGGSNNSNVAVATSQYSFLAPNGSSLDTFSAWAAGGSLPSAHSRGGAAITYKAQTGIVSVVSMSGSSVAIASAEVTWAAGVPTFGTFKTGGTGSPLNSAALGTGGKVTQNPDGSTTLQFNYGAFGSAASTIVDGDAVLFEVLVQGANSGLISPSSDARRVYFGNPPTVGTIKTDGSAVNILTGYPSVSFIYELGGVGGDAMLQARVRLISQDLATTFADVFTTEQVVSLDPTPELVESVQYYIGVTPTSILTPYPGSASTGAEVTALFTTSGIAAPDPPLLNTVTPNATVLGAFDISVTCASPSEGITPTLINVYYRLTGATDWILLLQYTGSIVISQPLLFTLADELALNTSYDFMTTCTGTANTTGQTAESAFSNIETALLVQPNIPGIAGLLHVAQNVTSYSALFRYIDATLRTLPLIATLVDLVSIVPFGGTAPATRYGTSVYRTIQLDLLLFNAAERDALYAVFHNARELQQPIYFRDYTGRMYVVAVPAENDDLPMPDTLEEFQLTLTEQAYTYDPTAG